MRRILLCIDIEMRLSYVCRVLTPALLLLLAAIPAYADGIIFQSATLGPTGGSSGTVIGGAENLR